MRRRVRAKKTDAEPVSALPSRGWGGKVPDARPASRLGWSIAAIEPAAAEPAPSGAPSIQARVMGPPVLVPAESAGHTMQLAGMPAEHASVRAPKQLEEVWQFRVMNDRLNVIGEDHVESEGRLKQEKQYLSWAAGNSGYWDEDTYKLGEPTLKQKIGRDDRQKGDPSILHIEPDGRSP